MIRTLKAERMKLKRSPVWLAFLIMPIVPAALGTINYLGNLELLTSGWYSLWTQHTLFTCYFFLPIMIGVYCSYIMHEEEVNRNWNKTLALPQKRMDVFLSKLIMSSLMVLLSEIWIGALFVISGRISGISGNPPMDKIILWCVFGTLGGTVMCAVQLFISLYIKSFALPVGISLAGGLSGLVFLAKDLGHIWPYSLMAYGMNSNAPQELMESGYAAFVIICVIYIAVFTVASSLIIKKRDM